MYAVEALDLFFEHQPDTYVSGNIFLYYKEGDPTEVISPDVLVAFDIGRGRRRTYKVWEEGKAPDFILEITSESTRARDQGVKKGLYAYLGVREYFQYDPTGDYLKPVLGGWRLDGDHYVALPVQALNGTLMVHSEVLGLELRADLAKGEIRFYDPATGERLLSRSEAEAARRQAEARAAEEAAARQAAEARAAEEATAREAAEEELARLRAELARLRGEDS
jgi:Uma2 family endonuclease